MPGFEAHPELVSSPRLAAGLRERSILLISALHDAETWMPQLDSAHLPLYRALRAVEAPMGASTWS
jgi:hypothetical protein